MVRGVLAAAELAAATGRDGAAAQYAAWASASRAAYHASFYDPVGGVYGDATPTAFAAALWVGAVPAALLPAVVERFVWQLSSVGYSLETMGFIGVRYVFEALARVNRTDVALRMLRRTEYPSYGYQITNDLEPATSLWECQVRGRARLPACPLARPPPHPPPALLPAGCAHDASVDRRKFEVAPLLREHQHLPAEVPGGLGSGSG